MQPVRLLGRHCNFVCRTQLFRVASKMPKVPITSKRARTVLSAQSLVPDSVKAALASGQGTSAIEGRRSSRLAALANLGRDALNTNSAVERGASNGRRSTAHNVTAAQAAEETAAEAPELSPSVKVTKPRQSGSKQAAAVEVKLEQETLELTGSLAAKERPKKRARRAKRDADNAAGQHEDQSLKVNKVAVAAVDRILAGSQQEGEGKAEEGPAKKSNRRKPAGFAVRGDAVDDSTAARRARLKAAMRSDQDVSDQVPRVLNDEIQRMCQELGNDRLAMTAPWDRSGGAVGSSRMWVGCHVSTAGGMERAILHAAAIGCRAFALDTRSKLRWESPPLTDQTVQAFKEACQKFGFGPEQILPHGSYLINLASPDAEMAQKGYNGFLTELQRCERLGLKMYNFHPGSTTGLCTHEESMDRIAGFINAALAATRGVIVVLENMASVGNIVGGRLWHLRYIIDRVTDKSRIGFCIDTCHLFSSGMDLRTDEACQATFQEIDEVVGLKYLRGMHINDSKTPFDSHRDRHENIGRGTIPLSTFRWIMNNPAFEGIPLIMETPVQEREPPINYKKSLEHCRIVWKDPEGPYGPGTDRRDVMVLNSLIAM